MTDARPPVELPAEVSVINVGLPLFADALREQHVPVQPVDWRIPAGGDLELVAALEELFGPRSEEIEAANAEVVRRLDQGVPQLVDVVPAGDGATRYAGAHVVALRSGHRLERGVRPAPSLDAGRGRGRGLGHGRRRGGSAAQRGRDPAGAGLPVRHRGSHGQCDRPVGATARRPQPGRRHSGVRPGEPGTGRYRLVRTGHVRGDRSTGLPAATPPAPCSARSYSRPARSTSGPWPRRACRSATTSTCARKAPRACWCGTSFRRWPPCRMTAGSTSHASSPATTCSS